MTSGADSAAPRWLGGYPLLSEIGRGSMGVLYRSVDPKTQRPVALKTLRPDVSARAGGDTAHFLARLASEAAALAALDHPGIVGAVAHGEADGVAFLALEYVEGVSLQKRLEAGTVYSVPDALGILCPLLDALEHAHAHGVWHRDVKPSNILITAGGLVKLTDFGIAHRRSSGDDDDARAILGTPGYIAPETYLSLEYDGRVDVFAAGAILYLLLTGRTPFAGAADQIMFEVCSGDAPPPPSAVARSPSLAPLDAVVLKALARNPAARFARPAEFRDALLQALGQFGQACAGNQSMPRGDS